MLINLFNNSCRSLEYHIDPEKVVGVYEAKRANPDGSEYMAGLYFIDLVTGGTYETDKDGYKALASFIDSKGDLK